MSVFQISNGLSVICFRRQGGDRYFAVREFDAKVIRSPSKGRGRGPSEQAIRASIRQAILNMELKSERATKAEIQFLKTQGVLGKRAPSCSLLNGSDMVKLLEAFHKDRSAEKLRQALRRSGPLTSDPEDIMKYKAALQEACEGTKRKGRRKRRRRSASDIPTTGLDTLLTALEASGTPLTGKRPHRPPAAPATAPFAPCSDPLTVMPNLSLEQRGQSPVATSHRTLQLPRGSLLSSLSSFSSSIPLPPSPSPPESPLPSPTLLSPLTLSRRVGKKVNRLSHKFGSGPDLSVLLNVKPSSPFTTTANLHSDSPPTRPHMSPLCSTTLTPRLAALAAAATPAPPHPLSLLSQAARVSPPGENPAEEETESDTEERRTTRRARRRGGRRESGGVERHWHDASVVRPPPLLLLLKEHASDVKKQENAPPSGQLALAPAAQTWTQEEVVGQGSLISEDGLTVQEKLLRSRQKQQELQQQLQQLQQLQQRQVEQQQEHFRRQQQQLQHSSRSQDSALPAQTFISALRTQRANQRSTWQSQGTKRSPSPAAMLSSAVLSAYAHSPVRQRSPPLFPQTPALSPSSSSLPSPADTGASTSALRLMQQPDRPQPHTLFGTSLCLPPATSHPVGVESAVGGCDGAGGHALTAGEVPQTKTDTFGPSPTPSPQLSPPYSPQHSPQSSPGRTGNARSTHGNDSQILCSPSTPNPQFSPMTSMSRGLSSVHFSPVAKQARPASSGAMGGVPLNYSSGAGDNLRGHALSHSISLPLHLSLSQSNPSNPYASNSSDAHNSSPPSHPANPSNPNQAPDLTRQLQFDNQTSQRSGSQTNRRSPPPQATQQSPSQIHHLPAQPVASGEAASNSPRSPTCFSLVPLQSSTDTQLHSPSPTDSLALQSASCTFRGSGRSAATSQGECGRTNGSPLQWASPSPILDHGEALDALSERQTHEETELPPQRTSVMA